MLAHACFGLLLLLSCTLHPANASPLVVRDYRIRDPDVTPVLGRGYSMTTNEVLSTCLDFTDKTEPTYNFNFEFLEIDETGTSATDVTASMSASVGWGWASGEVSGSVGSKSTKDTHSQYVVAQMSTERYYSSIDDTTASLTSDAQALVEKGDLVSFFQSCGSGYIRSIRRTAEFTGVFEFTSSSETTAKTLASSVSGSYGFMASGGVDTSLNSTSSSDDTSMTIKIKAFGIGLNQDGAESMIATSFEQFNDAVKYAFKSMQNDDVGMIYGVEIVPWTSNLQFNNAVDFQDQQMIVYKDGNGDTCTESSPGSCHRSVVTTCAQEDPTDATKCLVDEDPEMVYAIEVKAITMINAEYITMLESFFSNQQRLMSTMTQCARALKYMAKDERKKDRYLLDHTRMHMDPNKGKEESVTVTDAAAAFTPAMIQTRRTSLKAFVRHFYGPCATEITKHSNKGSMTKYWWDFPECQPACDGEAEGIEGSTCCLGLDSVHFDYDKDKPVKKLTCKAQGEEPDSGQTIGTGTAVNSLDMFIQKFCMPEIDFNIPADPTPDL